MFRVNYTRVDSQSVGSGGAPYYLWIPEYRERGCGCQTPARSNTFRTPECESLPGIRITCCSRSKAFSTTLLPDFSPRPDNLLHTPLAYSAPNSGATRRDKSTMSAEQVKETGKPQPSLTEPSGGKAAGKHVSPDRAGTCAPHAGLRNSDSPSHQSALASRPSLQNHLCLCPSLQRRRRS